MPRMDKLSTYRTSWETNVHGGSVIYVRTRIVAWDASKNVTLRDGGWQTVTTKRKMVQASRQFGLGYTVGARKGEWFVTVFGRSPDGYESAAPEHGAVTFPYYDGITFNPFDVRAGTLPALREVA
jgi:hypothetical protein